MWEAILKLKAASLKIPETGETMWFGQSKTREERIRSKKISNTLKAVQRFVESKAIRELSIGEIDADFRSGKIYHINLPLVTVSTHSNTVHLHLPNWPVHPDQLTELHTLIQQGLEEADS